MYATPSPSSATHDTMPSAQPGRGGSTSHSVSTRGSLHARWMSSRVWAPAAFVSKVISRLAMGSMISDSRTVW